MNSILKQAVRATFQSPAETEKASHAVAVRKVIKRKARKEEPPVVEREDEAQVRESTGKVENPRAYAEGRATANEFHTNLMRIHGAAVKLYLHVAEMDSTASRDFIKGFNDRSEELKSKGDPDSMRIGAQVGQLVSRIRAVHKQVHGIERRENGKLKHIKGMGKDKVMSLLSGPGTVQKKLKALTWDRDDNPERTVADSITTRLQRAGAIPDDEGKIAAPSADSMVKVLGVRVNLPDDATEKEKITARETALKQSLQVTTAAIRQCPESHINDMVTAVFVRCAMSTDRRWQEWSASAKDHLQQLMVHEGVGRVIKAEKIETETETAKPQRRTRA